MVFRDNCCQNLPNHSIYASSVDMNALFHFLVIVACKNFDMWHMDKYTDFLYNNWPEGMKQHVVSGSYLPYQYTSLTLWSLCGISKATFATPLWLANELWKQWVHEVQVQHDNFFGMHLVRNRSLHTIDITHPGFTSDCEFKYPLPIPDSSFPTSPREYSRYLFPEASQIRRCFCR